jgi:hypothetical protein
MVLRRQRFPRLKAGRVFEADFEFQSSAAAAAWLAQVRALKGSALDDDFVLPGFGTVRCRFADDTFTASRRGPTNRVYTVRLIEEPRHA